MDEAVVRYQRRRDARLKARGFRQDDEAEETNNNVGGGGGHGNTRLPFGLCQRYNIAVGKDWQPKDAWDALADKGITPGDAYKKIGKKTTVKDEYGKEYREIKAGKVEPKKMRDLYGEYYLSGLFLNKGWGGRPDTWEKTGIAYFGNKDDLYAALSEQGVDYFKDPDTGEVVNPSKMKYPRAVGRLGWKRYQDISIGFRQDKTSTSFGKHGYVISGKGFDGKRSVIKIFNTEDEARKYARETLGCKDEDLRETKIFKDYKAGKYGLSSYDLHPYTGR